MSPLISDEVWAEAKQKTVAVYSGSTCLPYVERCIEQFEQTNKSKYTNDFKEFVFESSIEDFCDISNSDVVISTIHKAKGREFDNVYMLISDNYTKNDDLMRKYYVGMTRAKRNLFIHTNSDCFKQLTSAKYIVDQQQYNMPDEIVLQLSYKDVYLNYFRERKHDILTLKSGDELYYKDSFLFCQPSHNPVVKLSRSMQDKLYDWDKKGYKVKE